MVSTFVSLQRVHLAELYPVDLNNRSQTISSAKFTVLDLKMSKKSSSRAKGRKSDRKDGQVPEELVNDGDSSVNNQPLIDEEDEQIVGIERAGSRPVEKKIDSANLRESEIRICMEPNVIDNGLTSKYKLLTERLMMLENLDSSSNDSLDFSDTEDETEGDEEGVKEKGEKRNGRESGSSVEIVEPSYLNDELYDEDYYILLWLIFGALVCLWGTFKV